MLVSFDNTLKRVGVLWVFFQPSEGVDNDFQPFDGFLVLFKNSVYFPLLVLKRT